MMISKIAGFDWDEGNWPKCGKHGVSKEEIESVFAGAPSLYFDPNHSEKEQRFRAIGKGLSERFVLVAFAYRISDELTFIRPISARYMHKKEIDFYGRT